MINQFIKENLKKDEKIFLPKSKEEYYINIDTFDKFKKIMNENKLNFPLMLKFSGDTEKYDHLIINILCDSGLVNFIEFFEEYTKKDKKEKIKIVLQQFINHGGYIIKLYRIANKSNLLIMVDILLNYIELPINPIFFIGLLSQMPKLNSLKNTRNIKEAFLNYQQIN